MCGISVLFSLRQFASLCNERKIPKQCYNFKFNSIRQFSHFFYGLIVVVLLLETFSLIFSSTQNLYIIWVKHCDSYFICACTHCTVQPIFTIIYVIPFHIEQHQSVVFLCSCRFWHALWLKMLLWKQVEIIYIAHRLSIRSPMLLPFCRSIFLLSQVHIWSHVCYVQLCLAVCLYMNVYLKALSSTKFGREKKYSILKWYLFHIAMQFGAVKKGIGYQISSWFFFASRSASGVYIFSFGKYFDIFFSLYFNFPLKFE